MTFDNRCNGDDVHLFLVLLVCITIVSGAQDCWWTGCRPNATGCDTFDRTEKAREACDGGGFKYRCCAATDGPPTEEIPADRCWWSECGPKDATADGCPSRSVMLQSETRACAGGDGRQYLCCTKRSALLDYYNGFKITDRHADVADEYLYAASKRRPAPDSERRNPGRGRRRAAGENATEHAPENAGAGVDVESEGGPSPRDGRGPYERRMRQTYADRYGDAEDDGRADGDDDGGWADGDRDDGWADVDRDGDGARPAAGRYCDGDRRVVGYYTSWNPNEMTGATMEKLTHVVYAFLIPQADGSVDFDSPASLDRSRRLMELRQSYPHVKVMFAVGGGASSQQFSAITASAELRKTFADSVVRLANDNGFDGVDIDWEFPVVSDAVRGTPEDKANYVLLMKELREALNAHAAATGRSDPYLISFAGSAGQWALDPGFDLPGLLEHADFANAMAYDYFGVWGAYTGPPAPLYAGTPAGFPEDFSRSNVDWTVGYYLEKIGAPDRVNVGVPFYGWYWNNVGDPIDAGDPMWRKARPVDGEYKGGATQWRRILDDHLSDPRFQQMFHERCKTPYAWNEETRVFLGYEDQRSLGFKVDYAAEKNVGGLMIWAVDMDDDSLTLLNALHRATAELCGKSDLDFGPRDVPLSSDRV